MVVVPVVVVTVLVLPIVGITETGQVRLIHSFNIPESIKNKLACDSSGSRSQGRSPQHDCYNLSASKKYQHLKAVGPTNSLLITVAVATVFDTVLVMEAVDVEMQCPSLTFVEQNASAGGNPESGSIRA
jgi:hypothetical protein